METYELVLLIVLALSLAVQGINLAAGGFYKKVIDDYDAAGNTTTYTDTNLSYYAYVLAGSAASAALYIILLILKLLKKSLGDVIDMALFAITLVLQFAVATIEAIFCRNYKTTYNSSVSTLAAYDAAGTTGTTVNLLRIFLKI
jgi:hypothetical protein